MQERVVKAWQALPEGCRKAPATAEQLEAFEHRFTPIPPAYRWFLQVCGGGTIGSEWIDGIGELADSHEKFERERAGDRGWRMREVFVIGWDGSGNPIALDNRSGAVVVEDHTFGGVHRMAESFEAFLVSGLVER